MVRGRHFEAEIILLCLRWYLRFGLSFRNLEEMMAERNLSLDHVTIWRWVQRYAPELNRRCRPELRPTNRSCRLDETYLPVAGKWTYLYRAVDSTGATNRFSPVGETRYKRCEALLSEGLALTWSPSVSSDQRGWEPSLSESYKGAQARRRAGSTLSMSTCALSEQHRRAGSPVHQTAVKSQSRIPLLPLGGADDGGH